MRHGQGALGNVQIVQERLWSIATEPDVGQGRTTFCLRGHETYSTGKGPLRRTVWTMMAEHARKPLPVMRLSTTADEDRIGSDRVFTGGREGFAYENVVITDMIERPSCRDPGPRYDRKSDYGLDRRSAPDWFEKTARRTMIGRGRVRMEIWGKRTAWF